MSMRAELAETTPALTHRRRTLRASWTRFMQMLVGTQPEDDMGTSSGGATLVGVRAILPVNGRTAQMTPRAQPVDARALRRLPSEANARAR
jgi:hypothetical protein